MHFLVGLRTPSALASPGKPIRPLVNVHDLGALRKVYRREDFRKHPDRNVADEA
jgi:hypothetical protein